MRNSQQTIASLIRERNIPALKKELKALTGFEIAELIENTEVSDQVFVFSILSPELATEAFDYLSPKDQMHILSYLPSDLVASILTIIDPDDRTALLEELPKQSVDAYINLLSEEERNLATTLLSYPEDSVGRLMTTDYIAVKFYWSIEKALDQIRAYGHYSETIDVIYVVDDNNVLIDDIPLKEFLFAPKDALVEKISDKKFILLHATEKNENAIETFRRHDRVALPVVDKGNHLLGIVTIDDILRLASEKNTETIQKVGGTEALEEPYMTTPFLELMKKRARWLVVIFIGEMFTATAMGFFEEEIAKAVVLALFLPLIISSGGNAGSQSSTLIIRAMALRELRIRDWFNVMRREILSGIFLGAVLGIIGFSRVALWTTFSNIYGEHWLLIAFTIFFALLGVVLWGTLSGAMLPFILRKMRIDPATASAPLVATIVDVTGILIYFGIAMVVLKGTLL